MVKCNHIVMANHNPPLDYAFLDDVQELTTPEQLKAISDGTRQKILGILGERSRTTSQLAEILGRPKGTAGHHLRVLARAGLIRVVRTRQVRAMTEKYYGRVAREWIASGDQADADVTAAMLRQVVSERVPEEGTSSCVLVHSRLSCDDAQQFIVRVQALAREFTDASSPEELVYGFVGGVYLTDWPALQEQEREQDNG